MLNLKLFRAEFLKIKKTKIWLLLFISPLLTGILSYLRVRGPIADLNDWKMVYTFSSIVHAMLFLPLLTGIFTAFICRHDHLHGGWKQLLIQPIKRYQLYCTKATFVIFFIILTQLLFLLEIIIVGSICGITAPFPTTYLFKGLIGGVFATLPLIALQMWLSVIWSSFATPMVVCAALTIPGIIINQSERFGPIYPWSQPLLAMVPTDVETDLLFISTKSILIVLISFIVLFAGGLINFNKKAY
ncbi:ABC transporter permease [Bacillus sp. TL12]|uniref:ABC transporter permease n=1 Tax=Bacillus sp. TL12 TaxID=2894756 RepID=UPI001F5232C9|nr:ABC transporter permease [Bacillus sp. TL12]MCI0768125.1 ABC transporter permease [Bacillus sp. TL12]